MNPETKTLRDWFACNEKLAEWDDFEASASKAMCVALAGEPMPDGGIDKNPIAMMKWEAKWRAALKYIRADAMLAARQKAET